MNNQLNRCIAQRIVASDSPPNHDEKPGSMDVYGKIWYTTKKDGFHPYDMYYERLHGQTMAQTWRFPKDCDFPNHRFPIDHKITIDIITNDFG